MTSGSGLKAAALLGTSTLVSCSSILGIDEPTLSEAGDSTSRGATLVLAPSVASFGLRPLDLAAAPVALTLTNAGNGTVAVAFGPSGDAQLGVTYASSPALP